MPKAMEFGLLGPLVVRCDGTTVSVGRGKQRAILAVLLLNANQVVSVDRLAASLWGSAPPDSARVTVRNYIKRLRQALGEAGRERISTRSHGYLLSASADELDISRFEVLLESARAARRAGAWDLVSAHARTAMSLWRGEPLTDMGSQELSRQLLPWLTEMRLQALEAGLDADMHLGGHADVVPELRGLTRLNPLREHLHALLMLALYRCGRQGEALAAYAEARQLLVDELGVEPGNELRDLHRRILAADPGLALGQQAGNSSVTKARRDLPGAVRHFVGRERDLAALTEHLMPGVPRQPALVISVIAGTAGVGKTALALQWAHQMDHCFPDGQLYVNMRGYDPGKPMTAADALASLLRGLGVADQDIPAETEERSARYRNLMFGRKIFLLLDNVSDVSQVRPLLPAAPGCATVVTSRDSMAGLVARDGAQRVDLDLLPLPDAIELLRALIGSRVDAEPDSATRLARQCARLPLTLRLAAELAAWRPSARLADLTAELEDQRGRLDLLDASGDGSTDIRAVFFWSYRQLDGAAARAFRMAGLQPGPSFDRCALAALTGSTVEEADQTLDVLARAYLVRPSEYRRYGMHDLLSAYARELAAAYDGDQGERLALTRLFGYYLHAAGAAMDAIFPAEAARRPRISESGFPALPITDKGTALAWLDAERANLTAVAAHGASRGLPEHVIRMAATLFRYFDAGGHFPEAMTIHAHARSAAALTGDRAAEATALTNLAVVHIRLGRDRQAARHTQRALDLHRETGDRNGEARALHNLGVLEHRQGHDRKAADDMRHALDIYRQTGDRIGQIRALSALGNITMRQGYYQQSSACQQEALVLARAARDRTGEAYARSYIGTLQLRLGCYEEAGEHLDAALALHRELGDRNGVAGALNDLGDLHLRLGRWPQAGELIERALAIFRELGDRNGAALTLNGLGEVLLAAGAPAKGRVQHVAALRLARGVADKYEQARSHCGLARSHEAEGDSAAAACHWQDALALYAELDTPEGDQIRALLERN